MEKRKAVMEFYSQAALKPKEELCCPVGYNREDVDHIPQEVLNISYGCGSPVELAAIRAGEVVVDLGSGGGVDCFIAAKKVGSSGKIIGIDMTDSMIEKARASLVEVADKLSYNIVEFKKGFLENIPIRDEEADLVTSNCVINLSPDKEKVFTEIHRILKDKGRFCISDIVSEKDVPPYMQENKRLWGECISGALRRDLFLDVVKRSGFYGLEILNCYLYKEVEGVKFYSITLKGYKYNKSPECLYKGHGAIYNGPFSSVYDDDGHEYPAGVPVEVCTDTAAKLKIAPYTDSFTILDPEGASLTVDDEGSGCGPKCC